jgi:hypothetical protein
MLIKLVVFDASNHSVNLVENSLALLLVLMLESYCIISDDPASINTIGLLVEFNLRDITVHSLQLGQK